MFLPSTVPWINPTRFSSERCREIVGWAKGSSSTMSLQMQEGVLAKCNIIESLAGWPIAFSISAIWVTFDENPSILVIPILQY